MKYEDIRAKHNLTNEQAQYLDALCQQGNVYTNHVQDYTENMSIIGAPRYAGVHVRHTDLVLHIDLFDSKGDTVKGGSWALKPEGAPYAVRGVQL